MSFRDDLLQHAHQLETERETASDLWTWLPSYHITREAHGDHATNFMPSNAEVMREATAVLSRLCGYTEEHFPFDECCCDNPVTCPSTSRSMGNFDVEGYLKFMRSRSGTGV